jgi:hypothetical protein
MLLMLVAVAASAASLSANNPETAVERSHERATRIAEAAADAIGGRAALESVKVVRIKLAGDQLPRLQMATPEPPHTPGHYQEETVIDLEQNRLSVVQTNRGAGFRGSTRIVLNGGKVRRTTYSTGRPPRLRRRMHSSSSSRSINVGCRPSSCARRCSGRRRYGTSARTRSTARRTTRSRSCTWTGSRWRSTSTLRQTW